MANKKKTPSLPTSMRTGSLPRPLADVWEAGIGALAVARKKGGGSFETLVDLGTTVTDTGSQAARTALEQVESAAASVLGSARGLVDGAADGVTDRLEPVVEGILARLGVPGRDEVLALRDKVEALQNRITHLQAASPPRTTETARTVYHVAPHERGWAVQRADAERATSVHPTKKEALVDARRTVRAHAPSRLVVYKADGTVGEETEYDA